MSKESIYKRYVPGLAPGEEDAGQRYWFAFSGGKLLLNSAEGGHSLPLLEDVGDTGIAVVRTQYLGVLEAHSCYSAELPTDAKAPVGMSFNELRSTYDMIDEDLYVLAGRALQIVTWDQTTQYCGRCGCQTTLLQGERAKKCPACGFLNYPRLSPAVITAVLKGDNILLARRTGSRAMYSILAGFVEPGETLEECLEREIMEEVGVQVKNPRYFTSQPWPFPNSLMIGFIAEWESGEISPDGIEISQAGWYSAKDLPEVPPKMTIAREIIDWFVRSSAQP
jgi:NAD+ diphosphatase